MLWWLINSLSLVQACGEGHRQTDRQTHRRAWPMYISLGYAWCEMYRALYHKEVVDITLRARVAPIDWCGYTAMRLGREAPRFPLFENMLSTRKPEVHNVSQRRRKWTRPRPHITPRKTSPAVAEGPRERAVSWNLVKYCTNVRRIALGKACNWWMTFKVIQGR